ncbi:multicopper oxidase-domain-containing protein [Lineolata rhizophorae]|uniref:Multicopper oxidase-domain-containing protein n=1 Tax=Lineolata rhizophorae TaxID=578093 RepID=A0A6A6NQ80_9PEZI|nr:multicopper oxidase-domain-containing protein [Lineolata rhizophorae]
MSKSQDGKCGAESGTCWGSFYGNCCGGDGMCGSSAAACGDGCQSEFGWCPGAWKRDSEPQVITSTIKSTVTVCPATTELSCPSYTESSTESSIPSSTPTGGPTSPPLSCPDDDGEDASLSSSTSATVTYTNSSTTATATGECTTPTPFEEEGCVRCEGQPGDDQWCGYDIDTDYYQHVPITCEVRHYDLHITNTTVSPDGIERIGFLVNGQMPGPVIEANWGDWIVINVYNELENNGTTIHWHGIRQNFTNEQDGVPSITQCPIAPGESYTYRWRASQYGTSWYHSHFAIQAWEGVLGGIIIHGPHSDEYDEDAGMIFLQDWSHATVDSMYDLAQDATAADGGPRVMDNGLINGMNTWNNAGRAETVGSRYELTFVPGRKYLLRVVNISIQSTFKFYIDGHKFKVISTDFVPIVPYETDILNINIGQRYNLIVEADQEPDDYWMRSDNQQACAGMIQWNDTRAVVHYVGGPMGTPTSTGYNYTAECIDEPLASLVPIMPWNAESRDQEVDEDVTVAPNANNLFKWYLSGTTFESQWGDPTLLGIYQDGEPPSYSGNLLIEAPDANEWVYIIIQSEVPLPHPIHLHGHDFLVLGSGSGTYADGTALQMTNPPRRDTALLPTAGWLVLAFETDNPGVWLMHCHVGWHTSMGFALQIVERMDEIVPTLHDTCQLEDTCSAWDSYAEANGIEVIDSGV